MRQWLTLLAGLSLAACAGPQTTTDRPARDPAPRTSRGMRADAHLAAAREHDARATNLARWPERRRDPLGFEDPGTGLWYRAFDTMQNEERLAAEHRNEAARLLAEYHEACAGVPSEDITVSPLQRYGLGGFPTDNGVVFVLSRDAGPANRLVRAMRCHRAWMMLGEAGMEDCPLDLRGIRIETYGDGTGISVEITADDARLVPELQRRAAHDLEQATRRRDAASAR